MNIVLIGFRGTGKSSIGKLLSNQLKRDYIDTDEYIGNSTGKTIKDIFLEKGEEVFRTIEAEAVATVSKMDNQIIATGGGVILNNKNVTNLKSNGTLILLEASPEIIHLRLSLDDKTADQRPSLTGKEAFEEIKHLLDKRLPLYNKAADHTINTSLKSPEEVVDEIIMFIEDSQKSNKSVKPHIK
ncbi:MAG: shikimate kinase [Candidatus Scalindua sp. AMX11]|nr:MAG: shikimate kinase [Candidatus Scalindua sp.]NOG83940.1 shikimate kinase [Planctomycetota bacterium]RZV88011.1 MAG: shikimate kinase [Candidatus Scalindua sp. SCAELEC01]TDE64159.1 MAG: shikimate kinase [Candidatus Scalindua sp. AMX11]GJQ58411.1 MAG: shikimate kinase [Candidatus Scalindua sp.]